jgi:hypothetical protein
MTMEMLLAVLIQIGGGLAAIASPSRAIQDRLARTWVVPR